jgi:hypothetical protein
VAAKGSDVAAAIGAFRHVSGHGIQVARGDQVSTGRSVKLTIRNWAKFQHYKDRNPPWVKLHVGLLDDFDFQCLPIASKALAPMLWLLASRSEDATIPADPAHLAFMLRWSSDDVRSGLSALIDKGFLISPSGVLATCEQSATPENREQRTEIQKEQVSTNVDTRPISAEIGPEPTAKGKRSRVPFDAIVALYHEALPELPRCEVLTEARKGAIRQRWAEHLPELDHWRNFFTHVRASRFLMGLASPSGDKPPFRADLEWLTRAGNFAKIAEGRYHR